MCWMLIWENTSTFVRRIEVSREGAIGASTLRSVWTSEVVLHKKLPLHGNIYWWLLKVLVDLLLKREIWSIWQVKKVPMYYGVWYLKKHQMSPYGQWWKYTSRELNDYLKEKMISTQLTFPNTTQQNEVVERKNRHFAEICKSMLHSMNVLARFWEKCTRIVVHITTIYKHLTIWET